MEKNNELNDRACQILKILVERYINDGQPVGSRALSKESNVKLSSASIRNVVADLEDMGLVTSPHTSSGRIPTVNGYRVFIDTLLTINPLSESSIKNLRERLRQTAEPTQMLSTASQLLSDVSRMAGLVTLPQETVHIFRHIEFLPVSENRVLVILVTNEQEVHHRVVKPEHKCSPSELVEAANYLNSVYSGKEINEVRISLDNMLQQAMEIVERQAARAAHVASLAFNSDQKDDDYLLAGQTNLMDFSELGNLAQLRNLFEMFNHKQKILNLIDVCSSEPCANDSGVNIVIGEESGEEALGSCSLITSPYLVGGKVAGVVGVIGPTRMHYDQVIPLVDITAKLLGEALNQKKTSP
ncbi:MAG: heat-inducible transcriptional repressor HrcA [Gammaproteobacteria bacterium]|nr:heat-inducible transcriptional repressor HrcA [Gammaproteobacteria bacterium]